ncbi:MAG TPA: tetratricopeptide repeat protein [Bryobacteraceae bacterium]|nr:tetratricopeptide repeat protein [Bryobacteraceae bacterium]
MTSANEAFEQALEHHREGRLAQAAELYQQVLQSNPANADALYLLSVIAHQAGDHRAAVQLNRRALALVPGDVRCYNVLGLALMELGRDAEAEASFRQGIATAANPELHNNLGTLWRKQGRLDDAIQAYQEALAESPGYANAHYNLGNAWRDKKEWERAAECFQRAVNAEPDHARALVALGQLLQALERPAEAVPVLERAASLIPGDAELYCDLGDALQTLREWQAAVDQYRKALACNPKSSRAWYAAGCAETSRNEYAAAGFCFQKALEADPTRREAQHNLGHSLFKLGRVTEAIQLFRQAAAAGDPETAESAIAVIIPGDPASTNQDILDARRAWVRRALPVAAQHPPLAPRKGAVRVGYLSAFFQDHNWMKPVWGLINQHDRRQFEVHLFSDAPASAIRHGYRPHPSDHFHDITGLSAEAAAQSIRHSAIDVLVDLNGYSAPQRLAVLALGPAPLIVGWFGIFATTGMSCFDWLVGDEVVIPPIEEQFYSERIVRVPGSWLTFEVDFPAPEIVPPPCCTGRPIRFGSFAPQYKITSDVVAAWSAILRQVPGSTLLLRSAALGASSNRAYVHSLFEAQQVPSERVRMAGPCEYFRFLETYGEIDIALDTFPYNGGTTTADAIWQGVPVITFAGDRWASRNSASILRAGGLGEFVCQSLDDYIALAVSLGTSRETPDRLRDLRLNMRPRLLESPVCDTRTFARNMEGLYRSPASPPESE